MTGADVDEIHDLIAVHATTYARFGRAATLTDEQIAKVAGRKITEADEEEYAASDAAEEEAFRAILAVPTVGVSALRTKVSWLQWRLSMGNRLEEDEVDLLLASLVETTTERGAS